ncbi:hypothetical protein B6U98_03665 [Thermoplasmatales archaeon ex4572_165]|nr:MAG: hypothetical protein B6U98_03665 [Thermoplasmatales archaeon ex4572_165]
MIRKKTIIFLVLISSFILISNVTFPMGEVINEKENCGGALPDLPVKNEKWEEMEKMPNYLDGTILDGSKVVIITEGDYLPEDLGKIEYEYLITWEEAQIIANEARQKYIEKYGIDPQIKDVEIPEGEMKRILNKMAEESTIINPCGDHNGEDKSRSGPHQINGDIDIFFTPAKDSRFKPNDLSQLWDDTTDGMNEFEPVFNVDMHILGLIGFWSAYDVSGDNIVNLLQDLEDDVSFFETDNRIFFGWVDDASGGSGYSWIPGHYCIARESATWPKNRVAQHELSHCFNAPDHGWSVFDVCVMSLFYLPFWWVGWCNSCRTTINNQIW